MTNKNLRQRLEAILDAGDPLLEKANVGNWLEARLHSAFTNIADDMFGQGYLTRTERIILSAAIGSALDTFNTSVFDAAPHLYQRGPWDNPPEPTDAVVASEAEKKEQDGMHPPSHYLVVEDAQKPSTWHLRVKDANGKVNHNLMGAAWAALHGGYRGNKYAGPGKQEAISKLTALYKKEGLDLPEAMREADVKEPAKVEDCVKKVMATGKSESSAWAICRASLGEGDMPKGVSKETIQIALDALGIKEVQEASDFETEFVPLVERAVRSDGTIPLKIIQPGWGSSGYYPAQVLERDGPKVFQPGLKMYWNHPTPTEETERPEGDLRGLAAELVSQARWVPDHNSGPGLYAEAKVFNPFRDAVDELSEHIGVSIRARGRAVYGQTEGQSGRIIQEITDARSVDFVTSPGAGGQILQLFEARRDGQQNLDDKENNDMTDQLEKELQEEKTKNTELAGQLAILRRQMLMTEAGEFVALELAKVTLPEPVKGRLLRDLAKEPPIKDDNLDKDAFKTRIAEAVKEELTYIVSITGEGQITGFGESAKVPAQTDEQAEAALEKAFGRLGLKENVAKQAARGR